MYSRPESKDYQEAWLKAERELAVNGLAFLSWYETTSNLLEQDQPSDFQGDDIPSQFGQNELTENPFGVR